MSYDVYGVHANVISYENLKTLCPQEIKDIESKGIDDIGGWKAIAQWQSYDDPDILMDYLYTDDLEDAEMDEIIAEYTNLVDRLKESFRGITGLDLFLDVYDEECGSEYDYIEEHEGCVFCVNGMMKLTTAGKKFKHIIHECRWVQGG